ncbi:MAG TPA: hypothetical protein VFP87_12620 [Chitinophagaceae bacterium]|nr:hypothetical protein [Chitinophagaceae bacterium]
MSQFNDLETSALLDMLAEYTRHLTELFIRKDQGKDYERSKRIIEELQAEIERRKKSAGANKSANSAKEFREKGSN